MFSTLTMIIILAPKDSKQTVRENTK